MYWHEDRNFYDDCVVLASISKNCCLLNRQVEAAARGGKRTRGAGLVRLEGMGRKRYILSADVDTDLRSKCE